MRTTIVVAQQVMTFCIAITQIKILGSCCQIYERHIQFLCHRLHLINIVHTMVCDRNTLTFKYTSIGQLTELIA